MQQFVTTGTSYHAVSQALGVLTILVLYVHRWRTVSLLAFARLPDAA